MIRGAQCLTIDSRRMNLWRVESTSKNIFLEKRVNLPQPEENWLDMGTLVLPTGSPDRFVACLFAYPLKNICVSMELPVP